MSSFRDNYLLRIIVSASKEGELMDCFTIIFLIELTVPWQLFCWASLSCVVVIRWPVHIKQIIQHDGTIRHILGLETEEISNSWKNRRAYKERGICSGHGLSDWIWGYEDRASFRQKKTREQRYSEQEWKRQVCKILSSCLKRSKYENSRRERLELAY